MRKVGYRKENKKLRNQQEFTGNIKINLRMTKQKRKTWIKKNQNLQLRKKDQLSLS